MYSEAGYLVPNSNNTYSISSQQVFYSIDIIFFIDWMYCKDIFLCLWWIGGHPTTDQTKIYSNVLIGSILEYIIYFTFEFNRITMCFLYMVSMVLEITWLGNCHRNWDIKQTALCTLPFPSPSQQISHTQIGYPLLNKV